MKYEIISDINMGNLLITVRRYIKNGWIPLSGICVTVDNSNYQHYYQAMIKTNTEHSS